MKVTIIDFETTGLNPETDAIVEIGALTFDTKDYRIVDIYSTLLSGEGTLSDEAAKVTGIEEADLRAYGLSRVEGLAILKNKLEASEYVLAHNADFDRAFFEAHFPPTETKLRWVDTVTAIPLGNTTKSRGLQYLLQHFNVDPIAPHRAITDCLSVWQILKMFRWGVIENRIASPEVLLVANLSYQAMQALAENDRPKKFGFKWFDAEKKWKLKVKECDLQGVSFPFNVKQELFERQNSK